LIRIRHKSFLIPIDSNQSGIISNLILKKNPTISKMVGIKWYSVRKPSEFVLAVFIPTHCARPPRLPTRAARLATVCMLPIKSASCSANIHGASAFEHIYIYIYMITHLTFRYHSTALGHVGVPIHSHPRFLDAAVERWCVGGGGKQRKG
jgi:hypothetical protein